MKVLEFSLPAKSRLLVAAILVVSALTLSGCATNEDYSASVSEPTNGTVIQNVTVYDVNEIDGARYELEYRLDDDYESNYTLRSYERKNGSYGLLTISDLTGHESTYKNDLPTPGDGGVERTFQLKVVEADTDTVVDAVTITLERDE